MRRFLATFCLLTLAAGAAPAEEGRWDFVISSGKEGGFYFDVGKRLRLLLNRQGKLVEQRKSQGSLENLAALDDPKDPANIALAQADALHAYLTEHPDFLDEFVVLDDVGKECVFFLTRRGSGIESAADLKKGDRRKLSVDNPDSGAAVTFELMKQLDPGFANTDVTYVDVMEGLLQLRLGGEYTDLGAVMLVQRPRTLSPALEIALDDLETFHVAPVRKLDLEKISLPGGRPVYTFETVTAGFGRGQSVTFETLCTRGLLLGARKKLSDAQRILIAQTILESGSYIAPGSD